MKHIQYQRYGKTINATVSSCGLLCSMACRNYETTSGGPYCNEFQDFLYYYEKQVQARLECQLAAKELKDEKIM